MIEGVGGVLALDARGILYSTARSAFGGDTESGGVRTAALARTPVIRRVTTAVVVRPQSTPVTHRDISMEFEVVPKDVEVGAAEVQVLRDGTLVETLAAQLTGSSGLATWPAGRTVQPGATYTAKAIVDPGTEREAESAEKIIPLADVTLEVSPDAATDVSADDRFAYVSAQVFYQDPEDPENQIPVDDGAEIRWEIRQGAGSLSTATSFTRDGLAATQLRTSTQPGESYVVKGRLTKFKIAGEEFQSDQEKLTTPLVVVPGVPSAITLTPSKTAYRSDGTDTVEFVAEVRDSAGNLVADGTDVAWSVEESVTRFQSPITTTTNGRATATLLAPTLPVDQAVEAHSGFASAKTTISVGRVTGELTSSSQVLDIAQAETAAITASVQAAEGTPVTWVTSNGSLVGEAQQVTNGQATATLSAANGRLGDVVVSATIGDRILFWKGEFDSTSGLAVGAERPFLVGDAESDGVETVVWPDGSVHQVPFWTATPVHVKGPANSIASVSLPGSQPTEVFTFDEINGDVITGLVAAHELVVRGATLDAASAHAGAASLSFDGADDAFIEDSDSFDFTDGLDVSLWVNPAELRIATFVSKGVWSLEMLPDGRIRGRVTTSVGEFTATTERRLSTGVWQFVSLQLEGAKLSVAIESSTTTNDPVSGNVLTNDLPIVVGARFHGNVDDLALSSDPGGFSAVRFDGVDALGRMTLDDAGRGTFTVATRGVLPNNADRTAVTIRVSVNPEDEDIIIIVEKSGWVYIYDPFLAFFGGDPETSVGIAASIAGGILIVGDIGALAKNGWRTTGWSSKDPNVLEASLSGLGLLTEIAVGAGEVADVPISTGRTVVAKIGNSPLAKIIYNRIKTIITKGGAAASAAETAFMKSLAQADDLAQIFKEVLTTDELYEGALRAFDRFGPTFFEFVRKAATNRELGIKGLRSAIAVLGDVPEVVIASLKASPSKVLPGLFGLVKILKAGVDPQLLKRVLTNCGELRICNADYTAGHLLDDLGELANIKGIDDLLETLKIRNVQAAGFRYELEAAAHLKRLGTEVVELTKRITTGVGNTDIDIVIREGGQLIHFQAKRSADAFRFGKEGLTKAQAWVAKALADLGTTDIRRVRYLVPPGVRIPPQVANWFQSIRLRVDPIPHL